MTERNFQYFSRETFPAMGRVNKDDLNLKQKGQDNVVAHELAHALFANQILGMQVKEISFVGDGSQNAGFVKVETDKNIDPLKLGALALASVALESILPNEYIAHGTGQDMAQAKAIEAQSGVRVEEMIGYAANVLSKIGAQEIRNKIIAFKTYKSLSPALLGL